MKINLNLALHVAGLSMDIISFPGRVGMRLNKYGQCLARWADTEFPSLPCMKKVPPVEVCEQVGGYGVPISSLHEEGATCGGVWTGTGVRIRSSHLFPAWRRCRLWRCVNRWVDTEFPSLPSMHEEGAACGGVWTGGRIRSAHLFPACMKKVPPVEVCEQVGGYGVPICSLHEEGATCGGVWTGGWLRSSHLFPAWRRCHLWRCVNRWVVTEFPSLPCMKKVPPVEVCEHSWVT